jgi:hypothetical protein
VQYTIKTKEIDHYTDYPVLVLAGLTGLGVPILERLAEEGKFPVTEKEGERTINGKQFLSWSHSNNNVIEVQSNH